MLHTMNIFELKCQMNRAVFLPDLSCSSDGAQSHGGPLLCKGITLREGSVSARPNVPSWKRVHDLWMGSH